jgi:hypothetical protein
VILSPRGPASSTLGGPPRPAIRTLADGTPGWMVTVRAPAWAAAALGRDSRYGPRSQEKTMMSGG